MCTKILVINLFHVSSVITIKSQKNRARELEPHVFGPLEAGTIEEEKYYEPEPQKYKAAHKPSIDESKCCTWC